MIRVLRPLFALLLAVCFTLACGPGPSAEQTAARTAAEPFRIAVLTWVGYGPIYIAQEKGFFEGLKVEIESIDDTPARRAALASGRIDASADIVDSFVNAASAGIDALVVLKLDDSMGGDGIVVRGAITTPAELRGKTIAYPPGQPSHFFLLSVLDEAGLTIKDIETRPMEADQAGAAFIAGAVDAAVTWEPWLSRAAEQPGTSILITSRERPGLIADVFTVRRDVLASRPAAVRAFAEGWFRAVDYWRTNREDADAIMARALGLQPEELKRMVEGVRYADRDENQTFFSGRGDGPSPFAALVGKANAVWSREGVIQTPVDPTVIDGSAVLFNTP